MKTLIKAILKPIIQKLKKSQFIRSLLSENNDRKSYSSFARFIDSSGNTFDLLKEIRDEIKPGWRSMFDAKSFNAIPSKNEILVKSDSCDARSVEMIELLQSFSFDVKDKRILEIGCYNGAQTYSLAGTGALEVTGSDLSQYYVIQNCRNTAVSENKIKEQYLYLSNLRDLFGNAARKKSVKLSDVKFLEDDICKSKIPSGSYDLVCSFEVLEHIGDPLKAFQHMYRVLKPGGMAYHHYNPFFSLIGGHSLCTLDFLWGHTRLNQKDFVKYLETIRPQEAEVAKRFYLYNLNRMSIQDLEEYAKKAGFGIVTLILWPEKKKKKKITPVILTQSKRTYPHISLKDLISPSVQVVLIKK